MIKSGTIDSLNRWSSIEFCSQSLFFGVDGWRVVGEKFDIFLKSPPPCLQVHALLHSTYIVWNLYLLGTTPITMGESKVLGMHKAIEELITTYQELNGSQVAELTEVPSPIEFMQYVRRGRPCVIRGTASEWPATKWTVEYLENKMKGSYIQVAITPLGCVDSFPIEASLRCWGEFLQKAWRCRSDGEQECRCYSAQPKWQEIIFC